MASSAKEVIRKPNFTISGPYKGNPKPDGSGHYEQWKVSFKASFTDLYPKVNRQITASTKEAALQRAEKTLNDVAKFGHSVADFDRDELMKIANQAAANGKDPIELLEYALKYNLSSNPHLLDAPLSKFWPKFKEHHSSKWTPRVVAYWNSFYNRYHSFFDQRVGNFLDSKNGTRAVEALLKKVSESNQGDPATNTLKTYRAKARSFLIWLSLTGEVPQLSEGTVKQAFFNSTLPDSRSKHEFNPIITPDQALLLIREFSKKRLSTYAVLQIFMGARTTLIHGLKSGAGWKRKFINMESGKIHIPAEHTKTLKKKQGSRMQTIAIDTIPALRPWLEYSLTTDALDEPNAPIAGITQPAVSRFMVKEILMPFKSAWFHEGETSFVWQDHYRNALRNSFFSYGLHVLDKSALQVAAENRYNADSYENLNVVPKDARRYFGLRPNDLKSLNASKIRPLDQSPL